MKIYHLEIQDADDRRYDIHYLYTHPTKDGNDLFRDYHASYDYVVDKIKEWSVMDIIRKLKDYGWTRVETDRVKVQY